VVPITVKKINPPLEIRQTPDRRSEMGSRYVEKWKIIEKENTYERRTNKLT